MAQKVTKVGVTTENPTWKLGNHWEVKDRSLPHPARAYSLFMEIAYLTIGVSGFFKEPTQVSKDHWGTNFLINCPHSVIHIATGVCGLVAYRCGREHQYARAMSVVFALLSLAGFLDQPTFGLVSLQGGDLFLHGFTSIGGDVVCRVEVDEALEEEVQEPREQVARSGSPLETEAP